MFEKQMYVTKHQEMIFKLNSFYYDKYKKSFNFMGLFDGEVSKSSYELVDYRFRAPTYNRGDVKWPVMHID